MQDERSHVDLLDKTLTIVPPLFHFPGSAPVCCAMTSLVSPCSDNEVIQVSENTSASDSGSE